MVFIDVVLKQLGRGVEHDDTIIVVINLIVNDPTVPTLDHEYPLTSGGVYSIVVDDCVTGAVSSKSYIRLVIQVDLILFDVGACTLNQQNPLSEIRADLVLDNRDMSTFDTLDSSSSVVPYDGVLVYLGVVLSSGTYDPIFLVLFNGIEFDLAIASNEILGNGDYSILKVLLYCVHYNEWI